MAQNENASQPSSKALWLIIPIAIGLSLLLTNIEYTAPKENLPGKLGEVKKEMAKPDTTTAADTTSTPADTTHMHSAPANATDHSHSH